MPYGWRRAHNIAMHKRILRSLAALAVLLVIGTGGYIALEGWGFLDSLYMTLLTFTTVGFQEVRPLSAAGRVFTIFLMALGVSVMLYFLTSLMQGIIEDELFQVFVRRRRMRTTLSKMRQHYILCGFGRVGKEVARAFSAEGAAFIVIDADADAIAQAVDLGYPYLQGNATEDAVLNAAGVEWARGLVAATGDDSDNVFITLTARGLNGALQVVARTADIANAEKLKRAGADRVISPMEIGGRRLAMSAVRPLAVDFLDSMISGAGSDADVRFAEVDITEGSPLAGRAIGDVMRAGDMEPIGLRRADGSMTAAPHRDVRLEPGDSLFVIGVIAAVDALLG